VLYILITVDYCLGIGAYILIILLILSTPSVRQGILAWKKQETLFEIPLTSVERAELHSSHFSLFCLYYFYAFILSLCVLLYTIPVLIVATIIQTKLSKWLAWEFRFIYNTLCSGIVHMHENKPELGKYSFVSYHKLYQFFMYPRPDWDIELKRRRARVIIYNYPSSDLTRLYAAWQSKLIKHVALKIWSVVWGFIKSVFWVIVSALTTNPRTTIQRADAAIRATYVKVTSWDKDLFLARKKRWFHSVIRAKRVAKL